MKEQGSKFPLLKHGEDILIADHLWNRLSGVENSTEIIFDALRSVSKSDQVQSIKDFFTLNKFLIYQFTYNAFHNTCWYCIAKVFFCSLIIIMNLKVIWKSLQPSGFSTI